MKSATRRTLRAFTLIEVLVALAVLAISLAAAVKAVNEHVNGAAALRDRTLAHWVARNQVTELRVARAWVSLGVHRGEENIAGSTWRWEARVSPTPDTDMRRVEIKVSHGEAPRPPAASLTAFLPRPG